MKINKQVNGRWRASLSEVIGFIDIIPFNNMRATALIISK